MPHVIPIGKDSTLSMANCALYCHVYYGFIQTIPRQITWDNDRIIETIALLRLVLLCGLDCDIFNLISLRLCGCLAVQEQRPWVNFCLSGHLTWIWDWNRKEVFRRSSCPPVLPALLAKPTAFISKLKKRICPEWSQYVNPFAISRN